MKALVINTEAKSLKTSVIDSNMAFSKEVSTKPMKHRQNILAGVI